jgi:hypothetical protein
MERHPIAIVTGSVTSHAMKMRESMGMRSPAPELIMGSRSPAGR